MELYGKIFVVVAVLAIILTGVFIYLVTIDRKLRKVEKELKEKSTQTTK